ncbi:MAG: type II secretion system protein, partial [Ruminiclostridium sp.]
MRRERLLRKEHAMIKKITQLKRRKGFTLVECIVAIA